MNTTDNHLDAVAVSQLVWKPSVVRNLAREIVEHAIRRDTLWPDDLQHDGLSSSDKQCIGIAFRLLLKFGVIQQTGQYRRSQNGSRNGGAVFQYRLASTPKAQTFLSRNPSIVARPEQQSLPMAQPDLISVTTHHEYPR